MNCAATNTIRPPVALCVDIVWISACQRAGVGKSQRDATTRDVGGAHAAVSRGLGQTVVPTIERVAPVVTSVMSEQNLESPG